MNPTILEMNAYLWFKEMKSKYQITNLSQVPEGELQKWHKKGIDYLWLMGIWTNSQALVRDFCYDPALVESYKEALPDWKEEDVKGSPFAIDDYEIHSFFGTMEDLSVFYNNCHQAKLKLILDFIPNHFSAYTPLAQTHEHLFLKGDKEDYNNDSRTFFHLSDEDTIFAHGKDPYFEAWQDTLQLDYSKDSTHEFMTDILMKLAEYCDGVRCDMAMLCLNEVFQNHWSRFLTKRVLNRPNEEFWDLAIKKVKKQYRDFLFIAEVYWNMEWDLQELGFDYTYDKELYDRLSFRKAYDIKGHLRASHDFQCRSLRFIENHDEKRAISQFGEKKSQAAFVIISTIQGMCFLHDGQEEGLSVRLPVQLGRRPEEMSNSSIREFYHKMTQIMKSPVIKKGQWLLLEAYNSWEGNDDFHDILAWIWQYREKRLLICVNYSESPGHARIPLNLNYAGKVEMKDILTDKIYHRESSKLNNPGLYVELGPYESHIFSFSVSA